MKQRIKFLLIAFMAMFCVSATMQASVRVTFKLQYNGTLSNNYVPPVSVAVLANGNEFASNSENIGDDVTLTLDDIYKGKELQYMTNRLHEGSFVANDGVVVTLDFRKLSVDAVNDRGEVITEKEIEIKKGDMSYSLSLNKNGKAVDYLAPGIYDYSWYSGTGTIDLTSDATLSLIGQTEYRLEIIRAYNGLPVKNEYNYDYYYLYPYGKTYEDHFCFSGSYSVAPGSYWVEDLFGGFSGKIEVNGPTKYLLESRKVTFNLNTEEARIKAKNAVNGNWRVIYTGDVYYLLPGEYTCAINEYTSFDFTVGSEDVVVDQIGYKVQLNTGIADANVMNDMEIYIIPKALFGKIDSYEYWYYSLRLSKDAAGVLTMENVSIGDYMAIVNSIGIFEFSVSADATIDMPIYYLQFTTNNPELSRILVTSPYYDNYENRSNVRLDFGQKLYLPKGEYLYAYSDVGGAYSGITKITLDKNTTIDNNALELTVTVKDTNGEVVPNMTVYLQSESTSTAKRTNEQGVATFRCSSGEFLLFCPDYKSYSLKRINISGDMSEILTIPGIVTFSLDNTTTLVYVYSYEDRQYYNFVPVSQSDASVSVEVKDKVAKGRLVPDVSYYIKNFKGTTRVSEGCTITLGTLNVTSEGMGLAFPMENWESVSSYPVIVGSPVRLTAIPVTDDKFKKWMINGREYSAPMLDFKTSETETTAKAIFGGAIPNNVRTLHTNTSFNSDDQFIYLPEDIEGMARIYTLDGKLMKSIGVVGNQVGIYDLPAGTYVISLSHDGEMVNARFLKK